MVVEHVGLEEGQFRHILNWREGVTSLGGDCGDTYFRTGGVQKRAKYPWSLHPQLASPLWRQWGESVSSFTWKQVGLGSIVV